MSIFGNPNHTIPLSSAKKAGRVPPFRLEIFGCQVARWPAIGVKSGLRIHGTKRREMLGQPDPLEGMESMEGMLEVILDRPPTHAG